MPPARHREAGCGLDFATAARRLMVVSVPAQAAFRLDRHPSTCQRTMTEQANPDFPPEPLLRLNPEGHFALIRRIDLDALKWRLFQDVSDG